MDITGGVYFIQICVLPMQPDAVVDEDGKKELKEALSAEEYEMVTATSEFKIKWFFFGKDHAKESD